MLYFAYGSNIDENQMLDRKINYTSRQFAKLLDYRLVFNKKASKGDFTYANIIEAKGDIVEGALYELSIEDIEKLDKFEGFPNHYYRDELNVIDNSGISKKAFIYIAKSDKIAEGFPKREYLNCILVGQNIFTEEYFNKLKESTTID